MGNISYQQRHTAVSSQTYDFFPWLQNSDPDQIWNIKCTSSMQFFCDTPQLPIV